MASAPQVNNLWLLCCVTFFVQFCFGFGLNVCRLYVPYISEQRYRNTTNFFYVPLVITLMLVPMALSGWLCHQLGYSCYFILCISMAPVAWLVLGLCRISSHFSHLQN